MLQRPPPLTLPGVFAALQQLAREKGAGGSGWGVRLAGPLSSGEPKLALVHAKQPLPPRPPPTRPPTHPAGSKERRQRVVLGLLRACRESETRYLVRTLVQARPRCPCYAVRVLPSGWAWRACNPESP